MVQLIRDYDNGILTIVGSVKFDDSGDFLTRMQKLQDAINVLKEKVHETLVDEWIEASESKDQFMENEEGLSEADYWDGDDSEKGQ